MLLVKEKLHGGGDVCVGQIGFCRVQMGSRERSLDAGLTACSKVWG